MAMINVERYSRDRAMILLHLSKKRREPGEKCHARTMMHSKPAKLSK
jgi:hypothetical protein